MSAPSGTGSPQGTAIGKYRLLDCIAESMMSKVYRAHRSFGKTSRIVVVKTLHPRFLSNEINRERFYREIEATMSLAHANIVQIYDHGEEDGCPFIVMEWVHGRTLKDILGAERSRRGKGIDISLACHFAEQIALGLEHAHTLKDKLTGTPLELVHRDLSPHNVIVAFDGAVKLIDFGIARMAHEEDETLSEEVWGKAGYFSPEQALGERLDRRSDIFVLGAVLYELLSGNKLFGGKTTVESLEKIRTADVHVPKMLAKIKKLHAPLAKILKRCLQPNPKDRYAFAGDVARDLRSFLASEKKSVETARVARYLSDLFPGAIQKDQAALKALSLKAEPISLTEGNTPELDELLAQEQPASEPIPVQDPPQPRRAGRWLFRFAVVIGLLAFNPMLRPPPRIGILALKIPPASTARVTDGKREWVVKPPLGRLELPPGEYRAYLADKSGKRRMLNFQIRENFTTQVFEDGPGPESRPGVASSPGARALQGPPRPPE